MSEFIVFSGSSTFTSTQPIEDYIVHDRTDIYDNIEQRPRPTFDCKKSFKYNKLFLKRLRRKGEIRREETGISSTMWMASKHLGSKKGVLLDAGCGEGPDADIALNIGFEKAYCMDMFKIKSKTKGEFIKGDITKKIPLENDSVDVVLSHWVLPLLRDDERLGFYKEVFRILKPNGHLVYTGGYLSSVNPNEYTASGEKERLETAGLVYLSGGVAHKI